MLIIVLLWYVKSRNKEYQIRLEDGEDGEDEEWLMDDYPMPCDFMNVRTW